MSPPTGSVRTGIETCKLNRPSESELVGWTTPPSNGFSALRKPQKLPPSFVVAIPGRRDWYPGSCQRSAPPSPPAQLLRSTCWHRCLWSGFGPSSDYPPARSGTATVSTFPVRSTHPAAARPRSPTGRLLAEPLTKRGCGLAGQCQTCLRNVGQHRELGDDPDPAMHQRQGDPEAEPPFSPAYIPGKACW